MANDGFKYEYDLAALALVRPRGHDFAMYVTPRYKHHYEIEEYEAFTAQCLAPWLSRCSLFIDVGANYGFFTLLAATKHSHLEIIAFEPVSETFAVLRRNLEPLGTTKVHLRQAAASDSDGTASFCISMAADNCAFAPHPAAPPLRWVEVTTVRLDSLLAERQPCPTFIKIDVEGHEPAVLRGLSQTLARFQDLALLIEFNPKMLSAGGTEPEQFLPELDRLGFSLFLLDEEQRLPFRLKPDEDWRPRLGRRGYANLYCVRKQTALSVCLFVHSSGLGGAERSLLQLVKELVADYGAVCTVVLPGRGRLVEELGRVGAACRLSEFGWWGVTPPETSGPQLAESLGSQLHRLLRDVVPVVSQIDPDVVWTQTLVIPWGAVTAAQIGKPHVWSVCEYGELDHGLRFCAPFSQVVKDIVASSALVYTATRDVGETLFPAATGHWRVLYRNIELPESPSAGPLTGLFQRPGAVRLGVFATLHEGKGQEEAVRAVAQLVVEGLNVELLLAGHPHQAYWARLQALISELGLEQHVRAPGFLDVPLRAMAETDIVLICSRREAFGRVGAEAMLLGKPVVYSASSGSREYMLDGRTGLSYPTGDASALARVLRELVIEPAKRARLGAEALAYARARFSREAYGGEVFRTLRAISERPPAHTPYPSTIAPLLGQVVVTLAKQHLEQQHELERVNSVLAKREAEAARLAAEIADLRATIKSAEEWQGDWFARAFHRWRPGTPAPPPNWLRRVARVFRQKTDSAAGKQSPITRFFTRQFRSGQKRTAEVAELWARLAVRLGLTRHSRKLRASQRVIADSGLFDAQWYLDHYSDAHFGRPNPLLHFLRRGASSGYNPNPSFDCRWYLAQNPDAVARGLNPLVHYCQVGAAARRDPSPRFNTAWYLWQHPDAASSTTPLAHYLKSRGTPGSRAAPDAGFSPSCRFADPAKPFAPQVSVIVPNYNHARFLRQRLDSIYGQSYRPSKVILLDDCSTDESPAILREYADKFSDITELIINPVNSGCPFAQWKKGLAQARTDLVWIAESDDFCELDFLERLVPFFRDEAVQIAYCPTQFVDTEGQALEFSFEAYTRNLDAAKWKQPYVETTHREVSVALGIRNTIPNVSSALLRHPGTLPLLSDPAWLKLRVCGDWVFYLHHARGGKIAFTPFTRNSYRYHAANASRSSYKQPEFYREHELVARTVRDLYRVELAVLEKQRHFLREHWEYVFQEEPPQWQFDELYSLERINATPANRLPNVLVAGYDFATGGGEVFAMRMAAALREYGFGITYYDYNGQGPNPAFRRLLPPDVPVVQRNEAIPFQQIIEDFGIEIVHTHHACCDEYVARQELPVNRRPRHVVTMHGMYEAIDPQLQVSQIGKLMPEVDHWVYTADRNLRPFHQHQFYSAARFTKSRLGMKPPIPQPVERARLAIPADAFVVCVASRAIPEKGWLESIEAVEGARGQTARDIHLLLIGDGPVLDLLKRQRAPPYVHVLGFQSNPVDYYAMSDIGVLATRYQSESCPLTVIECLMAGRPVVASDIGEIRSILSLPDGRVAGRLLSLQDGQIPVPAFADALNHFIKNTAALKEATALAPAAAAQSDISKIVEQYAGIYANVLAEPVRGPDVSNGGISR
jgi:FkbM family methyltransferase